MKMNQPINSRIAGTTFGNGQEVLKTLSKNYQLIWKREPNNSFDKNAIMVLSQNNQKIGYIPKDLAKDLAPKIDSGEIKAMEVIINQITGGEEKNLGCNVIITCYDEIEAF